MTSNKQHQLPESVTVFAPGTSANLGCGFDVLGLAIDGVGDFVTARKASVAGVRITKITGAELPHEATQNVAGVAVQALLNAHSESVGIELELTKCIKPGSGLGSSAASAAGAVFAANEVLGRPFSREQLVAFAMAGEALASGVPHADNVAPCLLGGVTLVRSNEPLDVVKLAFPAALHMVVLHPQVELKTSESRGVLPAQIPLGQAVEQWQNLAGLVAGFCQQNTELIARSLPDLIVEPARKKLIPGFDALKQAAMASGALGSSISGAGPSVFALCDGAAVATTVATAMRAAFAPLGIAFELHTSPVNTTGCRVVEAPTTSET